MSSAGRISISTCFQHGLQDGYLSLKPHVKGGLFPLKHPAAEKWTGGFLLLPETIVWYIPFPLTHLLPSAEVPPLGSATCSLRPRSLSEEVLPAPFGRGPSLRQCYLLPSAEVPL